MSTVWGLSTDRSGVGPFSSVMPYRDSEINGSYDAKQRPP